MQPPQIELAYEPNLKTEVGFAVGGYRGEGNLSLRMYIVGDLNQTILLNENFTMIQTGEWKGFSANVSLPDFLEPGVHVNGIVVEEVGATTEGVGAIAGVMIPLRIYVPYPWRYIELEFKASDIAVGEKVPFYIKIISRSKEELKRVFATINIYDNDNQKVDSITSDSFSLDTNQARELTLYWDSQNNSVGIYHAVASVFFDGEYRESDTFFKIGDVLIEILNINGTSVEKDQIAKVDVETISRWNSQIKDVYAEVLLYDPSGNMLRKSKTETFTLEPWHPTSVSSYLDVRDLEIGDYQAVARVFYYDKVAEKNFVLNIFQPEKSIFTITNLLIIVIVILFILLILSLVRKEAKKR
ncbi:hypothetical protein HYT51_01060 [Candidatus Woesearchaeota archaeon]|nr:hypothetical protein [Candidatus Woesearchaeota archaeon]